jgi:hypothetical protein
MKPLLGTVFVENIGCGGSLGAATVARLMVVIRVQVLKDSWGNIRRTGTATATTVII